MPGERGSVLLMCDEEHTCKARVKVSIVIEWEVGVKGAGAIG